MAFPIAAAITGGATLASALLGSSAQKAALKQQAAEAARQNLISQKQLELSERMIDLGLATQIDANGNITWYDEATNTWRTDLAPIQKQLQQASDAEQLRALNYDAPAARGEMLRASAMRAREGNLADSMMQDIQDARRNPVSASDLASQLRLSRTTATNQAFDDVGKDIATQALRSGANGAGAASQLAASRARALAEAMGTPEIEGITMAEDINNSRLGSRINNYGAIAARPGGSDGKSFTPSGVGQSLTQSLIASKQLQNNNNAQAGSLLGNAGRPIQQPGTYNPAPLIGATGNALGDFFKAYEQSKAPKRTENSGWTWDDNDPLGRGGL